MRTGEASFPRMRCGLAAGALATVVASRGLSDQPVLRPVDQGYADRTPISISQRRVEDDLRLPLNFDRLYRIDGRSRPWPTATGDRAGWFARVSGGVVAMFPQSQYTRVGSRARRVDIPAGVVYLLQDSSKWMEPSVPARESGSLMRRLNQSGVIPEPRVASAPGRTLARHPIPQHSVWESEGYRRWRIGQLLDAALAAR